MCPFERVWRRAFQPRATVPAVAPHHARISGPETWEDMTFASQGGMMTRANLRNSVTCGVWSAPPGVPVEFDTSGLGVASTTSSSLRTLRGTQCEQGRKSLGLSVAMHTLEHRPQQVMFADTALMQMVRDRQPDPARGSISLQVGRRQVDQYC